MTKRLQCSFRILCSSRSARVLGLDKPGKTTHMMLIKVLKLIKQLDKENNANDYSAYNQKLEIN